MCAFLKIYPLMMRVNNSKSSRLPNENGKKHTSCQKKEIKTGFVGTSYNQKRNFCERMVWCKKPFLDILS